MMSFYKMYILLGILFDEKNFRRKIVVDVSKSLKSLMINPVTVIARHLTEPFLWILLQG